MRVAAVVKIIVQSLSFLWSMSIVKDGETTGRPEAILAAQTPKPKVPQAKCRTAVPL